MTSYRTYFFVILGIWTVLPTSIAIPQYAVADSINPGVFALSSKPYGSTYGQWAANWWNWVIGIPADKSPVDDNTGKNCAVGQQGPVWFLPGSFGGVTVRECTIPAEKALLAVILDGECSQKEYPNLKTEDQFHACVKGLNAADHTLEVIVDGRSLKDLESYRAESPMFNMTLPGPTKNDNLFTMDPGPTIAKAEGWYVILEPLTQGTHTIQFKGSIIGNPLVGTENYAHDTTYHLNVK